MTEKQFWMKLDQIAENSNKITEFTLSNENTGRKYGGRP